MRVLWFTNIPMAGVNDHFGRPTSGNGFWMHALIKPLSSIPGLKLAVVTADDDPQYHFERDGIEYFNIPQNKLFEVYGLFRETRLNRYLRQAAEIVNGWKPDLVHVHGTERFFGLVRARGLVKVPTVVSIQGVVRQFQHWSWGAMSLWDAMRLTSFWEISRQATILADDRRLKRYAPTEDEIIRGVDAVIGRTAWDHANARDANPRIKYFHIDEMMRPEFWTAEPWSDAQVAAGTIFTTSSTAPRKGLPILIRAMSILRRWGHDVRLKIAGLSRSEDRRSSGKFAFELIDRLGLSDVIELLGWVDAKGLVEQMRTASCFAQPSYAENSSNAISEAQLLGLPAVGCHSGGIPSLIEDGKTGLLFSRGDEVMLAAQIERLLTDRVLAQSIGAAARETTRLRHDPARIVQSHLDCYQQLVDGRNAN